MPGSPFRIIPISLAVVATLALSVLAGVAFQRKAETFKPLGFEAIGSEGSWLVLDIEEAETGLLAGDHLIQIEKSLPPSSLDTLRSRLHDQPSTSVLVERRGELARVLYTRPSLAPDVTYLLLFPIGAIYLLIGLYTAIKSRRREGRLFQLWCLTSAALYLLSPLMPPADRLDEAVYLVDLLARLVLPALTLHLFLVFPAGMRQLERVRRAVPFLYLPAVALLAVHLDWIYGDGRIAGPATAQRVTAIDQLELLLLVLFCLAGAAALLVRMAGQRLAWEARQQALLLAAGMLGGYLPFLVLYVTPRTIGWNWPGWTTLFAVLPLALVPLSFAHAILRYRLWDLGVMLRGASATALTVLVGLSGFALVDLAIDRGVASDMAAMRQLLSFAAGLAIAGVLVPTRSAIAARLEGLQHGGRLLPRKALRALGNELMHERDLDRLSERLLDQLGDALGCHPVNLYLHHDSALAPVRPDADSPRHLAVEALPPELWQREVSSLSALGLPAAPPTAEQRLYRAGYRYAFPLTVRGQAVALATLGYTEGDRPLSSEDVDLARSLFNQAALAIENARLLDEVQTQLDEVSRLQIYNQDVIDSSPAGLAVLTGDDTVRSANHAFAALVGVGRPQLAGRPIASLLPIRPLPTTKDGVIDVAYCQADGEERYLLVQMARFGGDHDAQRPGERVLMVQDVSERKAMELRLEEKERLASLGMLAAGVAHEVNTPLTGIASYAQMLRDELPEGAEQRTLLTKMEQQSFRASQIVNNLLAFARNREREHRSIELGSVFDQVLEALSERIDHSTVSLDWQRPDEPILIDGHEGEMHQVLTNLIVNAVDAMRRQPPTEPRRLIIDLAHDTDGVRACVTDTGPGIPAARLERIFQPFFSSKLDRGGTGLGLAITYDIVRRHGGRIHAENLEGRGCSFVITLPLPRV